MPLSKLDDNLLALVFSYLEPKDLGSYSRTSTSAYTSINTEKFLKPLWQNLPPLLQTIPQPLPQAPYILDIKKTLSSDPDLTQPLSQIEEFPFIWQLALFTKELNLIQSLYYPGYRHLYERPENGGIGLTKDFIYEICSYLRKEINRSFCEDKVSYFLTKLTKPSIKSLFLPVVKGGIGLTIKFVAKLNREVIHDHSLKDDFQNLSFTVEYLEMIADTHIRLLFDPKKTKDGSCLSLDDIGALAIGFRDRPYTETSKKINNLINEKLLPVYNMADTVVGCGCFNFRVLLGIAKINKAPSAAMPSSR